MYPHMTNERLSGESYIDVVNGQLMDLPLQRIYDSHRGDTSGDHSGSGDLHV